MITGAVATAVLGDQLLHGRSPTASPSSLSTHEHATPGETQGPVPGAPARALGQAAGAVPSGTTVFDDDVPGIAELDADLSRALRRAATDAAASGVGFSVDSGWRSAAYQQRLFDEAVARYGSEAEARRWVATPTSSAHVTGDAVDLGSSGAAWLEEHGAAYGLCRIYANEPWHFELRPEAIQHGCPVMRADAAHSQAVSTPSPIRSNRA